MSIIGLPSAFPEPKRVMMIEFVVVLANGKDQTWFLTSLEVMAFVLSTALFDALLLGHQTSARAPYPSDLTFLISQCRFVRGMEP